MSYYWIESAMGMGGRLTLRCPPGGKDLVFIGRMSWRHQGFVQGDPAEGFEEALKNLNRALQQDAAEEMIDKGAV